jgi:hypothetical protein
MNQEMINLLIFMAICFVAYVIFRNIPFKEGMSTPEPSSNGEGVGEGASTYAAKIKSHAVKHKDALLISKYRSDYENSILHLDDLVDNLMLKTALDINHSDPQSGLEKLVNLNGAKSALNNVMKFIDSN